jgi:hypothetical protein
LTHANTISKRIQYRKGEGGQLLKKTSQNALASIHIKYAAMDLMHAWDSASFSGGGGGGGGAQGGAGGAGGLNQHQGQGGAQHAQHDEDGIFSISKVEYSPPRAIVDLVTSNNILVMALENSHIIRLDLSEAADLEGSFGSFFF